MKVLVVDDDFHVAGFVSTALKDSGFQVTVALDGVNGVMEAVRIKPDILVLDFNMPAADGITVWSRLRGLGLGHLPIIFMSALPPDAVRARVGSPPPNMRFLAKPTELSVLLATINELVAGRIPPPPSAPPASDGPLDLDA